MIIAILQAAQWEHFVTYKETVHLTTQKQCVWTVLSTFLSIACSTHFPCYSLMGSRCSQIPNLTVLWHSGQNLKSTRFFFIACFHISNIEKWRCLLSFFFPASRYSAQKGTGTHNHSWRVHALFSSTTELLHYFLLN